MRRCYDKVSQCLYNKKKELCYLLDLKLIQFLKQWRSIYFYLFIKAKVILFVTNKTCFFIVLYQHDFFLPVKQKKNDKPCYCSPCMEKRDLLKRKEPSRKTLKHFT